MLLQNCYTHKDLKEQGVALSLAVTARFLDGRGACRVHGGGFAGTIQAFVPNEMLDGYILQMESFLGPGSCFPLNIRPVGAERLKVKGNLGENPD
jgi:galactokinase